MATLSTGRLILLVRGAVAVFSARWRPFRSSVQGRMAPRAPLSRRHQWILRVQEAGSEGQADAGLRRRLGGRQRDGLLRPSPDERLKIWRVGARRLFDRVFGPTGLFRGQERSSKVVQKTSRGIENDRPANPKSQSHMLR
jgi:hypothetical protein